MALAFCTRRNRLCSGRSFVYQNLIKLTKLLLLYLYYIAFVLLFYLHCYSICVIILFVLFYFSYYCIAIIYYYCNKLFSCFFPGSLLFSPKVSVKECDSLPGSLVWKSIHDLKDNLFANWVLRTKFTVFD